ncbi:hypothetical protein IWX50DRAFT_699551 [Phyllosticta citricarpa]|uniref:trans-L-3-hydroxyproline dehydratase n=1 Tax=Phyllosticta citricarpa TaxID=55181 RepID=A0ABR1MT77_9PEZI
MHPSGEPTRIIYSGFPSVTGALLEQRAAAKAHHDGVRKSVTHEPRGHKEMYGAALRPHAEHVDSGAAHMGILFLTHEGYSTMCGHATLAASRLLASTAAPTSTTHPLSSFRRRGRLSAAWRAAIRPCKSSRRSERQRRSRSAPPRSLRHRTRRCARHATRTARGFRADSTRRVRCLSIPSFAAGTDRHHGGHPSRRRCNLMAGAPRPRPRQRRRRRGIGTAAPFHLFATAPALGFPDSSLEASDLDALDDATRRVKGRPSMPMSERLKRRYLHHPSGRGAAAPGTAGADAGVCFFAVPAGRPQSDGVGRAGARRAGCGQRGEINGAGLDVSHSLLSRASEGAKGGFVGTPVEEAAVGERKGVRVEVSGCANYTGMATWVLEKDGDLGEGFDFEALGARSRSEN